MTESAAGYLVPGFRQSGNTDPGHQTLVTLQPTIVWIFPTLQPITQSYLRPGSYEVVHGSPRVQMHTYRVLVVVVRWYRCTLGQIQESSALSCISGYQDIRISLAPSHQIPSLVTRHGKIGNLTQHRPWNKHRDRDSLSFSCPELGWWTATEIVLHCEAECVERHWVDGWPLDSPWPPPPPIHSRSFLTRFAGEWLINLNLVYLVHGREVRLQRTKPPYDDGTLGFWPGPPLGSTSWNSLCCKVQRFWPIQLLAVKT